MSGNEHAQTPKTGDFNASTLKSADGREFKTDDADFVTEFIPDSGKGQHKWSLKWTPTAAEVDEWRNAHPDSSKSDVRIKIELAELENERRRAVKGLEPWRVVKARLKKANKKSRIAKIKEEKRKKREESNTEEEDVVMEEEEDKLVEEDVKGAEYIAGPAK